MAIQNLITNKITEGVDKPLTNGQWQDATGLEVEDFISSRLQKAIARLSFSNETSELTGYNSDGEAIATATVINATPNYVPDIEIVNLRINSNNNSLKVGEAIELNQPSVSKAEVGIRLKVTYDILGKTYYSIDPQKVEFTLGSQTLVADRVIPNTVSDPEAVQFIDITKLFQEGIFNGTLTASCSTKDYTDSDEYDGAITLRKINISYTNKGYIEGNVVSFSLSGLNSSDVSKFRLLYYLDGSMNPHYADLDEGGSTVSLTLETGARQVFARVEYRADANLFYSNWVQTNIIVDCKNIQGNAVAVINSVPTEINNCSNALLYKICYASGTNGGDIIINSYISEDYDDIADEERKKNHILNSTTLSLMAGEDPNEKEFYSFFELETVSSSDARFIGFDINGQTVYSYDPEPTVIPYFSINVVENKYNVNGAFNHTPGATLNYSQINGSGSNVFVPENTNVLPGDGWMVDGRYTAYQVSASDQDLFKEPINLLSNLNNGFTFEFLLKTYNVNADDPVIKIGNLHIGPGYVRVHEDIEEGKEHESNSIHVNSKADFGKEEITHVLITYTKQYKPNTYLDTYNQLLSQGSVNYSSPGSVTPYDVLKIYVNGVINREIQVSVESLKRDEQFSMQIAPTTSDVKFYGLRTYGFPFTYAQVQKNYISSILDANDKKIFYDKNDILDESGKIALKKCINKYNVIVYAIPQTDCPLYYGNKGTAGDEGSDTSVLIHYANPDWAQYNAKMWGGKYKAQGSSAKKYLIHNCQYNIKKGKCLSEADFAYNMANNLKEGDEGYRKPNKYYQMPESDIKAKKFVGKVNYASSMQTHKQGACDLFDGAYKSLFQNSLDTKMPTGGRKAVVEKEFLYFYYNLKPGESLETITINDTLEDARFMGFQTWGPGKADDPTYGYGDNTPEYILMEGADNGNSGANFKIPWAAMQTYDSTIADIGTQYIKQQPASVTKNDFTTGLLIDDETIKFTAADDPLDVDYGVEEYDPHYTEANLVFKFPSEVKDNTLKRFVDFYNAMYQYDFTCYLSMKDAGVDGSFNVKDTYTSEKYPKGVTRYKLYCSDSTIPVVGDPAVTTAKRYDVFRWDALREQWVPAGLHMKEDNTTWEPFNFDDVYHSYTKTQLYQDYNQEMTDAARAKFGFSGTINTPTHLTSYLFPAMKEMFIAACKEYLDVEDIAYHQAVIRVLSGTDNRAKNTYFQIIGKLYTNKAMVDGVEVSMLKIAEGEYEKKKGYVSGDDFIEVSVDGDTVTPTGLTIPKAGLEFKDWYWKKTDKGDYKVRLMQDDLDTIFATDNNGQQLKPYYLLEPPFNLNLEHMWGDQHSSLFYPFDLCYATKINEYTGKIINYLIGSSANITSQETKLHNFFLRIQETLPAIAYNHTAEIYYELAQTLIQGGTKLYENSFGEILAKYANNSVSDPLSLSHGSNYEGEIQFLRNRLLLLASLTSTGTGIQKTEQTFSNKGTGDGSAMLTVSGVAKYLDYFYPNYRTSENLSLLLSEQNLTGEMQYDSLFASPTVFPNVTDKIIVQSIAVPGKTYPFSFSGQKLTGVNLSNIDKYEYLEITEGLQNLGTLPVLPRANFLKIDGSTTQYEITTIEIVVYNFLPVIEELHLTNTNFNNSTLDFRNCNRLETLDLRGCTGISSIILPEGNKLKHVYLPACIKSLAILNNPRLETLEFEEGTTLNSLTLNCSGVGIVNISNLIEDYFDFGNVKLLKLTGDCDLSLSVVERLSVLGNKCDLSGSYRILENGELANISYSLKKNLVKIFGDIDSTDNKVYFDYTHTPLTKQALTFDQELSGFKFTAGSDNIFYPFDSINFKTGNGINIDEYGMLDITYSSGIPSSVGFLDSTTGELTLYKNSNQFHTFKVVFNGSITAEGRIYIGYREPETGDFAYADGTFSPSYIGTKTLVGLVYAKQINATDATKLDLAILSNSTVSGIIAPDLYCYNGTNFNQELTNGKDQLKVHNLLQSNIFIGKNFKPTDTNVTSYEGYSYSPYSVTPNGALPLNGDANYQITKDYDISVFPTESGKSNTAVYKRIADYHMSQLAMADQANFGNYMKNKGFMNASYEIVDGFSVSDFDAICTQFNNRAGSVVPSGGTNQGALSSGNSYAQMIYPAFYKASIFQPETTGKLMDYYKAGNWYVPSITEMSLLIAHRIISVTTAMQAVDSIADWYTKNPKFSGNGIFTDDNKNYFGGFLTDLTDTYNGNYAYITSDVVDFKNAVYTITTNGNYSEIGWKASYSYSTHNGGWLYSTSESYSCRRDRSYTVPMCCQITINKDE